MAILILFFFSGATALVYEVIWSKYLALLLGSTIQAQTVVLAVFMGGLALGNKLFSRHADTARRPLLIYGSIEIAIGIYAFLFSFLYRMAGSLFAWAGATLLDKPGLLLLLKGVLSTGLLLGPTILMGGTLPILAAWLQRNTADASRRSARFYSINSFGAVCGAGLAGFWLVESYGMRKTMDLSALVNVTIGLIALFIGSMQAAHTPATNQPASVPGSAGSQSHSTARTFFWACIMVALTGAVSMGLEVLASRCLCLIFGASSQVFAIVLMAFILGISVGSALISSRLRKLMHAETTAILLLLLASLLIGLVVYNIENLVGVYLAAQSGLSENLMGYRFSRVLAGVLSIFVLGLPAASLGSVLPLWMRAASDASDLLGDRVGRLLTWNTLGAVGGSLLTGFLLMPWIGLRGSFTTLALVLVIVAVFMALATRRPLVLAAGVAISIFLIIAAMSGDENWRYIFSAGVFRLSDFNLPFSELMKRKDIVHLDFYEDAADATVSVENIKGTKEMSLRVDGKVDASSTGDASTQLLLAYLPLMAKSDSKEVFCFGMGSGITAGAALNYPIDQLTVAENCEPVLRAAALFDPWNNGVLTNSRARIYHEDARTVLAISPKKYDVIISEPSNPWMVGVASLFTRDFYQLAASRLKEGGMMTQWFHTYEMDDATVDLVLRTFESVFPDMEIWDAGEGDIIILGSNRPWESDTQVFAHPFEIEGVRRSLASIGLSSPQGILARRLASQRTAFAIAGPGPLQSDEFPILEYAAPRAFYIYLHRLGVYRLPRFDERTWQLDLASDQTESELAKLDPMELKAIFGSNGSVNENLQAFLQNHFEHYVGRADIRPIMLDNHAMPCSLQGTNISFGIYTPPSATTNMTVRQLVLSEYALRRDPSKEAAVAGIQNALDALPSYHSQGADWSPTYYADLAIKASLHLGEPERARAILLRALQLQPDSNQLLYLSRILLREKMLQPGDLAQK
jgi:spermidine synthase